MSKHTYNFNGNTSLESLAAWEEYAAVPINAEWEGLEHGPHCEKDAFTAGFDAAASRSSELVTAINALVAQQIVANQILWTRQGKGSHKLSEQIDKGLGL